MLVLLRSKLHWLSNGLCHLRLESSWTNSAQTSDTQQRRTEAVLIAPQALRKVNTTAHLHSYCLCLLQTLFLNNTDHTLLLRIYTQGQSHSLRCTSTAQVRPRHRRKQLHGGTQSSSFSHRSSRLQSLLPGASAVRCYRQPGTGGARQTHTQHPPTRFCRGSTGLNA